MNKFLEIWKKITLKIGDVQFKIVCSLLYYILLAPIGLISSKFFDFLNQRTKVDWSKTPEIYTGPEKMKNQ